MIKKLSYRLAVIAVLFQTNVVLAQQYTPLSEKLPLIGESWTSMDDILSKLLGISVGLAAVLAVIMLSIGGFKYMTSESIFNMGNAKQDISNAVVGLIIVLAAVLVLKYINPNLVELNIFRVS